MVIFADITENECNVISGVIYCGSQYCYSYFCLGYLYRNNDNNDNAL